MKVVDSILFHDEIDMLELRLNIMGDHVDRIVIVESDHTFTNIPKPYNFLDHADRFKKWHNKIFYVKTHSPLNTNPWDNEHWSRDQMVHGWNDLTNEDVVIVADVDEIIRPEAVDFLRKTEYNHYGLVMPASYYKFNYVDVLSDRIGYIAWACAFRNMINVPPSRLRGYNGPANKSVFIHHAGWHFSWMGNKQYLLDKLNSFSHTEFNNQGTKHNIDILDTIISKQIDHLRSDRQKWRVVDLDNYFPQYILDNKEKFKDYILPDTGEKVYNYYPYQILEIAT